jgi:outer membrane receptor protein involved in Fe transport
MTGIFSASTDRWSGSDGLPALINAGRERFKGIEIETEGELLSDVRWQAGYSLHSSRFVDLVQAFDGVPMQLAGNSLEMAPRHLAYAGVIWLPARGLNGWFILNYAGERYLNKRNTARADAYATLALGIGYRIDRHNVRLDVQNVTNRRPPVSESGLGDAQYYLLPARSFHVSWQADF